MWLCTLLRARVRVIDLDIKVGGKILLFLKLEWWNFAAAPIVPKFHCPRRVSG